MKKPKVKASDRLAQVMLAPPEILEPLIPEIPTQVTQYNQMSNGRRDYFSIQMDDL